MKRGFLLRAEERKAAARRRAEQKHSEPPAASTPAAEHRTDPQISKGDRHLPTGVWKQTHDGLLQDLWLTKKSLPMVI
jgi:hypothetical protein